MFIFHVYYNEIKFNYYFRRINRQERKGEKR